MSGLDDQNGERVAVRSFHFTDERLGLATVVTGTVLSSEHPAVRAFPQHFEPVSDGVPRERAKVAPQRLSHVDSDGNERVVEQGTWVDEDDLLVRIHPHLAWRRPPFGRD